MLPCTACLQFEASFLWIWPEATGAQGRVIDQLLWLTDFWIQVQSVEAKFSVISAENVMMFVVDEKKIIEVIYLITVFLYDHCPPFRCVMHAGLSGINQLKIAALFRTSSLVTKKSNKTREYASAFCYYHTRITHPQSRTGRCFSDAVNFFFLVNVEKELTMQQFSSGKRSNPSKIIRVGCINELLWLGVVFFWVTLQKSRNQNKARRRLILLYSTSFNLWHRYRKVCTEIHKMVSSFEVLASLRVLIFKISSGTWG